MIRSRTTRTSVDLEPTGTKETSSRMHLVQNRVRAHNGIVTRKRESVVCSMCSMGEERIGDHDVLHIQRDTQRLDEMETCTPVSRSRIKRQNEGQ